MEVRCSRCLRRQVCDEAKDWDFDDEGAVEVAPSIEGCPDFKLDPHFYCDELAHAVMDVYPEEFKEVKVAQLSGTKVPAFIIDIVITSNLSPTDRRDIALEITDELNDLNKEQLHIMDAVFRVSISYIEHGGAALDEDGKLMLAPDPLGDVGVTGPTGPTEHEWYDKDPGGGTGVDNWPDVPDFLPEDI